MNDCFLEIKRILQSKKDIPWEAFRLINARHYTRGDVVFYNLKCINGLLLDKYKDVLIASIYNERLSKMLPKDKLFELVKDFYPVHNLVVKERFKGGTIHILNRYIDKPCVINEQGALFEVNPYKGINSGLFLETRALRQELQKGLLKDKRVLNLFSYTGSLSVSSLLGKAKSVINVDSSKPVMKRAKKNYELNGLNYDERNFSLSDARKRLIAWNKKGYKFDAIIVDPPPFMPKGKMGIDWLLENKDLLITSLNKKGILIVISHEPSIDWWSFKTMLGLTGRRIFPDIDVWSGIGDPVTKILITTLN